MQSNQLQTDVATGLLKWIFNKLKLRWDPYIRVYVISWSLKHITTILAMFSFLFSQVISNESKRGNEKIQRSRKKSKQKLCEWICTRFSWFLIRSYSGWKSCGRGHLFNVQFSHLIRINRYRYELFFIILPIRHRRRINVKCVAFSQNMGNGSNMLDLQIQFDPDFNRTRCAQAIDVTVFFPLLYFNNMFGARGLSKLYSNSMLNKYYNNINEILRF